jgi:hypothetical protein
MDNKPIFVKLGNDFVINANYVRWMSKMKEDDCLFVCTRMDGCMYYDDMRDNETTIKVCRKDNIDGYNSLYRFFKE